MSSQNKKEEKKKGIGGLFQNTENTGSMGIFGNINNNNQGIFGNNQNKLINNNEGGVSLFDNKNVGNNLFGGKQKRRDN